jgi:hypothetical protein
MTEETSTPQRDPSIRRRRLILYTGAAAALILVAGVAAISLFGGKDEKSKPPAKLAAPLIVERIQLKPVGGSSGRGLAEVLRRGDAESLRVLAAQLKPSEDKQVYQLVLAGGPGGEKLLGNEAVGKQKIFVGESKVSLATFRQYKRVEIRLVTNADPPRVKTVLRGTIPR